MPPRSARKPLNTYHHGDLRDALVQAALREVERGGPEAVSISALAKKFTAMLREQAARPSKRSKLSRVAHATVDFGLSRNGIYRLMFASRIIACAPKDSELHAAAMETFALLLEALEAPAIGYLRERAALKIWASLHGVVMLAEQGLLTGQLAHVSREELVEDMVEQTKLTLSLAIRAARKESA